MNYVERAAVQCSTSRLFTAVRDAFLLGCGDGILSRYGWYLRRRETGRRNSSVQNEVIFWSGGKYRCDWQPAETLKRNER